MLHGVVSDLGTDHLFVQGCLQQALHIGLLNWPGGVVLHFGNAEHAALYEKSRAARRYTVAVLRELCA